MKLMAILAYDVKGVFGVSSHSSGSNYDCTLLQVLYAVPTA